MTTSLVALLLGWFCAVLGFTVGARYGNAALLGAAAILILWHFKDAPKFPTKPE